MPEKQTRKRARKARRSGKAPSTQAGEYVHEEIEHVREGKHGARSAKQAIAIGLSKARRDGVKVGSPPASAKKGTKRAAARDARTAHPRKKVSATRSRASRAALKRESGRGASHASLSRHAKKAAKRRTHGERSAAAKRAARTKGARGRKAAAKRAARTRKRESA